MANKQTYIIHTVLNGKYIETKTFDNVTDMRKYVDELNVPILPFSKIDEMGAGMYKGKKVSLQSRKETCAGVLNKSSLASSQEMAVTPTSSLKTAVKQSESVEA